MNDKRRYLLWALKLNFECICGCLEQTESHCNFCYLREGSFGAGDKCQDRTSRMVVYAQHRDFCNCIQLLASITWFYSFYRTYRKPNFFTVDLVPAVDFRLLSFFFWRTSGRNSHKASEVAGIIFCCMLDLDLVLMKGAQRP